MKLRQFICVGMALCLGGIVARAQTVVQNATYNSGNPVTIFGPDTVDTANSVTVGSGATVAFQAATRIRLGAGFHAQSGSFFHAVISASPPPLMVTSGSLAFSSSSSVTLSFGATDTTGIVSSMELYRNGSLVSTLTNPTSGSTWTFTDSSSLPAGTYTYDARAYDGNGNITTSAPVTVTVVPDTPSYLADFESSEGYVLGSLDQQLGWIAVPGTGVLVTDLGVNAAHGSRSVVLQPDPNTPPQVPAQISQLFAPFVPSSGAPNIIFVDFYAKPVAETDITTATTFNVGSARFAFVLSGAGQGMLEAFNGNGSGGGAWTSTNFTAPLAANNQALNWIQLTARLDFTSSPGTWDLYANGQMVAASQGFLDSTSTTLTLFSVQGDATTASEIDDILAGPTNPLFADVNNDGIDDAWETAHGLSLSVNDRNLDPINKGETVLQDYIYGADPNKTDTNGNGLADIWQIKYFGHIGVDPNADTDGDGLSNIREYLLGTNPTVDDRTPTTVLRLLLPGGGYQKLDVATLNLTF